jgi:hypothetical protein
MEVQRRETYAARMRGVPDWRKIDTRWVRQGAPEFKTEWYFSARADLLLWRRQATGAVEKFEVTWESHPGAEREYLFWDGRWVCGMVDTGEEPWGKDMAPIVQEQPERLDELRKAAEGVFGGLSPELSPEVREFVVGRLRA